MSIMLNFSSTTNPRQSASGRAVMKNPLLLALLVLVIAFIARCSGPATPDENQPLTMAESEGLIRGMLEVASDTMPQIVAVHSDTEFTIGCPLGGQARVGVTGNESMDDSTAALSLGIDFKPEKCELTGSDGTEFTLDANPGMQVQMDLEIVGFFEDIRVTGGLTGQLSWMVENRSGTCQADMDLEAVIDLASDPPGPTPYLVGEACEHDLRLDVGEYVALVEDSSNLQ